MESSLDREKVRQVAKALDDAIERHDMDVLIACFSEACEIRLPGITLAGHEGLRKAVSWMYTYLKEITLVPVTILIEGNVFFEEFIVKTTVGGHDTEVKQAEVLIYDDKYRVTSLRLYFDRLELARNFPANFIDRWLIKMVSRASLKGLAE